MPLSKGQTGTEYIVSRINTNDEEFTSFLFSLGCYSGESVTLLSKKGRNFVIAVKDGRYCIDSELASLIEV